MKTKQFEPGSIYEYMTISGNFNVIFMALNHRTIVVIESNKFFDVKRRVLQFYGQNDNQSYGIDYLTDSRTAWERVTKLV